MFTPLPEEARIVGISGFTVRPPQGRKEKPKVSEAPRSIRSSRWRRISQPGPAALTDGLAQIRRIIERWAEETRP